MITNYKTTDDGLSLMAEAVPNSWINVINPSPEEIEELKSFQIPHDYLTYPLDQDERSRTERENSEWLIILRVPYYQGESVDVPYTTIPLGIILTSQYIVTICKYDNEILREFISGRTRNIETGKRARFVLRLMLSTASKYLTYLRQINRKVDALEDQLQQSTRNKEVLELLKYQKSLTYFTTALKSNELLMERLQRSQLFRGYPEDEDLLEDVITENQQAIEMTSISSNILSSMMDAFASIISNNLNAVMKFLASVTIMLSLPTLIASFFGMNVHLPLENNFFAFMQILAISAAISLGVAIIFWKRDWF